MSFLLLSYSLAPRYRNEFDIKPVVYPNAEAAVQASLKKSDNASYIPIEIELVAICLKSRGLIKTVDVAVEILAQKLKDYLVDFYHSCFVNKKSCVQWIDCSANSARPLWIYEVPFSNDGESITKMLQAIRFNTEGHTYVVGCVHLFSAGSERSKALLIPAESSHGKNKTRNVGF